MLVRALTAAVGIVVVLAAVAAPSPWPLWALALIVVALCSWELCGLAGCSSISSIPLLGILFTGLIGFGAWLGSEDVPLLPAWPINLLAWSPIWIAGMFSAIVLTQLPASRLAREFSTLWFAPVLVWLAMFGSWAPMDGGAALQKPLVWLLAIVWAGDTAAMLVGSSIGKRPLAPTISPKKTVEGAMGNLAACVLAAWALAPLFSIPSLTAVSCGVLAGIFGQIGDLFQSGIKRKLGKKDSGTLLPGHGGVLDRIDSLLFAGPAVMAVLAFRL